MIDTSMQVGGATILQIRGMSRQFGGLRVIEDLKLDVARGEIVGILGPNGAGKSTLFNLISGVLAPDRGTIMYSGKDVTPLNCGIAVGWVSDTLTRFQSRSAT